MKAPIDLARINRTASGTMRVSGRVRVSYVNGVIDAEIKGTLNGTLNAAVTSGTTIEPAAPDYYLPPSSERERAEWAQSYTEGGRNCNETVLRNAFLPPPCAFA